VGVVNDYGPCDGKGLHAFQQHPDFSLGPVQFPVLWVLGLKLPEHDADLSLSV
jgi:hypothetical protein